MRGFFLGFTFDLPAMCVVDPTRLRLYALLPPGQEARRRSLKHP